MCIRLLAGFSANSNAMLVDDPQAPVECLAFNRHDEPRQELQYRGRARSSRSKNHDPSLVAGLIGPDVREVEIERDQGPSLAPYELGDCGILSPSCNLIEQTHRVVATSSKHLRCSSREILVKLELHAASVPGISTMRSRANSAAYEIAAGRTSR